MLECWGLVPIWWVEVRVAAECTQQAPNKEEPAPNINSAAVEKPTGLMENEAQEGQ